MDTGSNVNILSEEAYKQYSPKMELRPFHEQVLSATNDPFWILGMFTGCLMFETGVKIDAEVLVTPDTDVPLILGTQIMEENKMSIDFHSRQLMMETEM